MSEDIAFVLVVEVVVVHEAVPIRYLTLYPVAPETAVQFIDTAGASYDEELEPDGESRRNPQEADLVCRKVRALLDAGVPATAMEIGRAHV